MNNLEEKTSLKVIASNKTWIESEALEQLKNTSKLQGMKSVVGLPDLHPGKDSPIGAAFLCDNVIYPHLVGNDIGCGMGLFETQLSSLKIKMETWVKRLSGLDEPYKEDCSIWLEQFNVQKTPFDKSLGTIGGGNHFVELQKIEKILDKDLFEQLNLDCKKLYLMVHSGSRGYGQKILESFVDKYSKKALTGAEKDDYLALHNNALLWAKANRLLIAHRFTAALKTTSQCVLDIFHNFVEPVHVNTDIFYLHRKGATPSTQGAVIIPGSRGDFSYLVYPTGLQKDNLFSLAHGAGRKWKRSDAKGKLSNFRKDDFVKTKLGNFVICEDKNLIFEEAPEAYKKIEHIIDDLESHGLIKVIAILRPVITYKTQGKCS
jgi:release factor H-coupled RctB family protein